MLLKSYNIVKYIEQKHSLSIFVFETCQKLTEGDIKCKKGKEGFEKMYLHLYEN